MPSTTAAVARCGDRLEDAGITPWLRRHRLAVATTTAVCVIVGAGAVAYRVLVPPPLDPQLRVTVTDLVPSTYVDGDFVAGAGAAGPLPLPLTSTTAARAAYGLTPDDPADTAVYAVIGIEGPAVRASTARDHRLDGSVPVASNIDVIVDCVDNDIDPEPGSYALLVSTRCWNRTVVGRLPLVGSPRPGRGTWRRPAPTGGPCGRWSSAPCR